MSERRKVEDFLNADPSSEIRPVFQMCPMINGADGPGWVFPTEVDERFAIPATLVIPCDSIADIQDRYILPGLLGEYEVSYELIFDRERQLLRYDLTPHGMRGYYLDFVIGTDNHNQEEDNPTPQTYVGAAHSTLGGWRNFMPISPSSLAALDSALRDLGILFVGKTSHFSAPSLDAQSLLQITDQPQKRNNLIGILREMNEKAQQKKRITGADLSRLSVVGTIKRRKRRRISGRLTNKVEGKSIQTPRIGRFGTGRPIGSLRIVRITPETRLIYLRMRAHLTQSQLSKALGVSVATIRSVENLRISELGDYSDLVEVWAAACGVTNARAIETLRKVTGHIGS
jgi:hypothetical protein